MEAPLGGVCHLLASSLGRYSVSCPEHDSNPLKFWQPGRIDGEGGSKFVTDGCGAAEEAVSKSDEDITVDDIVTKEGAAIEVSTVSDEGVTIVKEGAGGTMVYEAVLEVAAVEL